MLWLVILLSGVSAHGAVWPDQWGNLERTSAAAIPIEDDLKRLADEFGLKEAETASYAGPRPLSASAYRFRDSTGALAFFEALRPPDGRPSKAEELAVENSAQLLLVHGNYVLKFEGQKPRPAQLKSLFAGLGKVDRSPLPAISNYLPARQLVPNSRRYVLGPVSLARFESRIPAGAAGFEFGGEGYLGQYKTPRGNATLAVFSYPTPNIAKSRVPLFEKIPGSLVRRSGPLVSLVLPSSSETPRSVAESLLETINYRADVMLSDPPPLPQVSAQSVGQMLLSIVHLAGFLLVLCIAGGILVGVFRIGGRNWFGRQNAQEPMITLHLGDRETTMRSKG